MNFCARAVIATFDQLRTGQIGLLTMGILIVMMVAVIAAIIYVERGRLQSIPGDLFKTPLTDKDAKLYDATNHRRNWIECVKSRKETACPAEVGHRTSTESIFAVEPRPKCSRRSLCDR